MKNKLITIGDFVDFITELTVMEKINLLEVKKSKQEKSHVEVVTDEPISDSSINFIKSMLVQGARVKFMCNITTEYASI